MFFGDILFDYLEPVRTWGKVSWSGDQSIAEMMMTMMTMMMMMMVMMMMLMMLLMLMMLSERTHVL